MPRAGRHITMPMRAAAGVGRSVTDGSLALVSPRWRCRTAAHARAEAPLDGWAARVLARTESSSSDVQAHEGESSPQASSACPLVAVVGRPNVGKSALFNRLLGKRAALVADDAGVTRDRLYGVCALGPAARPFRLVDTGGLSEVPSDGSSASISSPTNASTAGTLSSGSAQRASARGREGEELRRLIGREAVQAIAGADMLLIVTDGQVGPTPLDEDLIRWLGRAFAQKPIALAVNKCESPTVGQSQAMDFWEISQGIEPIPVSAISGSGTSDVLDTIETQLPECELASDADEPPEALHHSLTEERTSDDDNSEQDSAEVALAVVGRPNVGKSSLVNSISGRQRSIVSGLDGTTCDSVDTVIDGVEADGSNRIRLVDTAGLRRRASVQRSSEVVEPLSVGSALSSIRRCNVVALVTDAYEGPSEQDYRIARFAVEAGKAMVIVANKSDKLEDQSKKGLARVKDQFQRYFFSTPWASVILSCTQGKGKRKAAVDVLTASQSAGSQHRRRIKTGTLNEVVQEACTWQPPPARGSRRGKVYFATQTSTSPPTFVLFVNKSSLFSEDYKRFMERQLREAMGLEGTPVRLLWRERTRTSSKQSSYTKLSAPKS